MTEIYPNNEKQWCFVDRFIDPRAPVTLLPLPSLFRYINPEQRFLQLSPPPLSLPEIRFAGSSFVLQGYLGNGGRGGSVGSRSA